MLRKEVPVYLVVSSEFRGVIAIEMGKSNWAVFQRQSKWCADGFGGELKDSKNLRLPELMNCDIY